MVVSIIVSIWYCTKTRGNPFLHFNDRGLWMAVWPLNGCMALEDTLGTCHCEPFFSLFFNVMDPPTTGHQWIIDKRRIDNTTLSFQVQKKWWPPIKSTYHCELFVLARTFYSRDVPAHLRRAFSSFHFFFFFYKVGPFHLFIYLFL